MRASRKAISVGSRDGEMARRDRIAIYCELDWGGGKRKPVKKVLKDPGVRSTENWQGSAMERRGEEKE